MPVRQNRYFNDPNIGAGFSNLASIFAPPDPADVANYADAALKKQKFSQLAQIFAEAKNADERAIGADLYDPTNSFFAQNQNTATDLAKNAADNAGALARQFAEPVILDPGQVAHLPTQTAAATGLAPMFAGVPKPLSETEWQAAQSQRLLDEGDMTDADILASINSAIPVEQIASPTGPQIVRRSDAVGQEPFINPGATAKPTNGMALLQDGSKVPAVQGEGNRWYHAQTGEELPESVQVFSMPQPQGTAEEIGLGKPVMNNITQQIIDIGVAKNTAVRLRDLVAKSPSSQGIVGYLRGTAQNVIQTGGELGTFFGGGVQDVQNSIKAGLADAELAGAFDVNIPAIEMMKNLLAFQHAKTTTGERLSNEMLRNSRKSLGLDNMFANQADVITRLNTAISLIDDQEKFLRQTLDVGIGDEATTPTGDLPVAKTEANIVNLPPGTKFIAPDGSTRTK